MKDRVRRGFMSKIYKALLRAESEKGQNLVAGPAVEAMPGGKSGSNATQRLVTLTHQRSLAAEQFRKLKASIIEAAQKDDKRCFLITSAATGEGKSMVSTNLAISLAQEVDNHVLLVDADLRRSVVHKLLGLSASKGLADYLQGDGDLSQLLQRIPAVPRLSVLPAGTGTDSAPELISSQRMRSLAQELKKRYQDRYIVIDATPLMSTSESEILSREVDGIIFVVRAGKTPREVIRRSMLRLNQEKVLGVVLNDISLNVAAYRYGYYRYYSYYGDDEKQG